MQGMNLSRRLCDPSARSATVLLLAWGRSTPSSSLGRRAPADPFRALRKRIAGLVDVASSCSIAAGGDGGGLEGVGGPW
jgi:hypothetical protein